MTDMPPTTSPTGAATLKSLLRGLLLAMDSQNTAQGAAFQQNGLILAGLAALGTKLDAVATSNGQVAAKLDVLANKLDAVLASQVAADPKGAQWAYVATAGGLLSTTAVPIRTAEAGKRHYITSLQATLGGALTGTVVMVRDGAGGPVLWRGAVGPNSTIAATFPTPLRGTTGALLEVVLASNVSAAAFFNAQGFTA
jgi:outer membrane murein-binding lipoprotein Lpp